MKIGQKFGLEEGDIRSTSMGANGVDVLLSPAALRLFNLAIECKNVEKLNVASTFLEHLAKYKTTTQAKLLVHKKNNTPILATLLWEDLANLLGPEHGPS